MDIKPYNCHFDGWVEIIITPIEPSIGTTKWFPPPLAIKNGPTKGTPNIWRVSMVVLAEQWIFLNQKKKKKIVDDKLK